MTDFDRRPTKKEIEKIRREVKGYIDSFCFFSPLQCGACLSKGAEEGEELGPFYKMRKNAELLLNELDALNTLATREPF